MHDAIFVDDSAAWQSDKNIVLLRNNIQRHLNNVVDWTHTWGFILSKTKSMAVLFTNSRDAKKIEAQVKLTIHGSVIPMAQQVKFLGVTYDHRLTWVPHITNVVDRTKKAFNLMRSVAAQSWGASKRALLTIYRALVRSRLDYGCEAYHTACKTQLQRLDTIQSKCLKLCCGAFRTTAVNALQQDCGEMPLQLRCKKLLLRFATKVAVNPSNPASKVMQDHWKSNPIKYIKGKEPSYNLLKEYQIAKKKQRKVEAACIRIKTSTGKEWCNLEGDSNIRNKQGRCSQSSSSRYKGHRDSLRYC